MTSVHKIAGKLHIQSPFIQIIITCFFQACNGAAHESVVLESYKPDHGCHAGLLVLYIVDSKGSVACVHKIAGKLTASTYNFVNSDRLAL